MIPHHFTVDVEEHFQVLALAPYVPRESWESLESRVVRNVDRLLDLLARHGATGTFFTLGWLAERQPVMVRAITAAGHEMASHGYDHRRVTEQTPEAFRESVRRPGYGYAGGGRDPYWLERAGGRLLEVPPATLRRLGLNLPAAGGAYFRLLPYGLVRAALRDAERRGVPGTFYLHPWEYDPDQPRFPVKALPRIRHYGGLGRTWSRLERLLGEFRFTSIASRLGTLAPVAA